jgi:hypothetical protein
MTQGTTITKLGITTIISSSIITIMISSKTAITITTNSSMLTTKDMTSSIIIKAIATIKIKDTTRVIPNLSSHRIITHTSKPNSQQTMAKTGPTQTSSREGTQHL